MSKLSKFKIGDPVRVTQNMHAAFDKVGVVVAHRRPSTWLVHDQPEVAVKFPKWDGTPLPTQERHLTLADPDVHTVPDQMDAESRVVTVGADTNNSFTMRITDPEHPAFKDITEQEIDGDYVRGLAADPVNHPQHYGGDTTYETIKVIEAWGLGFSIGNCVKYLSRAGKKGPALEDLRKARFYLDREIAAAEAAQ